MSRLTALSLLLLFVATTALAGLVIMGVAPGLGYPLLGYWDAAIFGAIGTSIAIIVARAFG